jgi:hypothetical protein
LIRRFFDPAIFAHQGARHLPRDRQQRDGCGTGVPMSIVLARSSDLSLVSMMAYGFGDAHQA